MGVYLGGNQVQLGNLRAKDTGLVELWRLLVGACKQGSALAHSFQHSLGFPMETCLKTFLVLFFQNVISICSSYLVLEVTL